jgi:hypothetical protein
MARRHRTGETLQSARERVIIKEIQAAVGRELAARSEVPKTMPQRIADLLRELHRRLRDPSQEESRVLGGKKEWLRQINPHRARFDA